jgi:hypothetical protein
MSSKDVHEELGPAAAIASVFAQAVPDLRRLLQRGSDDFHSLRLYARGRDDTLAVLKRFNEVGEVEVLFGSATDCFGALAALEAGLSAGRWRVDKPYRERKGLNE